MKSKLLLIISLAGLFLLSGTNTQGQAKFGPVVGVNFSDMTGDYNSDGMLFGYHLGVLLNFGITDYLMVEPQLLYSTKGAKGSKEDLNLSYIEIPVWIRYQTGGGLNFNAGPYLGFLTSAKLGDTKVKSDYNSTDYGIAGQIGFQSAGGLGIAAGYFAGLADVGDKRTNQYGIETDFDAKINCIKLTLTYTVGGRRE